MRPRNIGNGRFIVTRTENFVNWCAWRFWLHRETSRTVFLEKLVVWGEWPPETLDGAQMVAQRIAEARGKIGYGLPVCDPAQPWDRWPIAMRDDLERRHREDFWWNSQLPEPRGIQKPGAYKTPLETELDDWIIAEAKKKPTAPRGRGAALLKALFEKSELNPMQDRVVEYRDASPELKAERLARLNARQPPPRRDDPRDSA